MALSKPLYFHFRLLNPVLPGHQPNSKGGVTVCFVPESNGSLSAGVAVCSPEDTYCKRVGRLISHGRAKKALHGKSEDPKILSFYIPSATAEQMSLVAASAKLLAYNAMTRICNRRNYTRLGFLCFLHGEEPHV